MGFDTIITNGRIVTATDTYGLSSSETFAISTPAPAQFRPVLNSAPVSRPCSSGGINASR